MSQPTDDGNNKRDRDFYLQSFSSRLDSYATTLSEREREILASIIFSLMDPLERMRWRDVSDLLQPDEEAILNELEIENTGV